MIFLYSNALVVWMVAVKVLLEPACRHYKHKHSVVLHCIYKISRHKFQDLSLGFILKIFLKLRKFQPRCIFKTNSHKKSVLITCFNLETREIGFKMFLSIQRFYIIMVVLQKRQETEKYVFTEHRQDITIRETLLLAFPLFKTLQMPPSQRETMGVPNSRFEESIKY